MFWNQFAQIHSSNTSQKKQFNWTHSKIDKFNLGNWKLKILLFNAICRLNLQQTKFNWILIKRYLKANWIIFLSAYPIWLRFNVSRNLNSFLYLALQYVILFPRVPSNPSNLNFLYFISRQFVTWYIGKRISCVDKHCSYMYGTSHVSSS